jgi:hypothetical protein
MKTLCQYLPIALIVFALGTGGCAVSPESIGPSYASAVGYRSWTCSQLNEEFEQLYAALARASVQQDKAVTDDIVGVLLIGIPVSTLSGSNIAPEIGRLKGEIEAVRKAAITTNCQRA